MTKEQQKKQEIGIVKKQGLSENLAKTVFLGIGSNIGNRIKNIEKASPLLSAHFIKNLNERFGTNLIIPKTGDSNTLF